MLKLNMPKKNKNLFVKTAGYNKKLNKKYQKAIKKTIKKTIKKEDDMKMNFNIILSVLSLLAIVFASYQFVFQTGSQYQKINSGIETLANNQKEIIKLNKSTSKRVSILERTTDKQEIYIKLHSTQLKKLEQKN